MLHSGRHGDPNVVERTARELLNERPDHQLAFEALSRHFRQSERWDELDALLAEQGGIVGAGAQIRLLEERMEIAQLHLDRPDVVYDLALERYGLTEKDHSGLLGLRQFVVGKQQALSLLEQVEAYLAAEGAEPDVELYLLVEWLATSHLARPQTALNALSNALSLTGNDLLVGRRLANLQRRQKKHRGLVETYRLFGPELLADDTSVDAVERWHLELGELLELNVLDFSGAVDVYERLLVERPEHVEALNRLKRLLVRVREASRFVEVIERLAALAEPPQDVLTFVDGARSVQAMGELGLAVRLWLQVLERAPGTDEAQSVVMRFARRNQDTDTMRRVHMARVQSARSTEQKAARYCDQAQFEREIVNDDHAAMSAFGEALQVDPQSAVAMVGLAELTLLHGSSAQIEQIGPMLLARFDRGLDDQVRDSFASRLADVQIVRAQGLIDTGQSEALLDLLGATYQRVPNAREAAQLYADHLFESGRIVEAGRIYGHTQMPAFVPGADGDQLRAEEHLRRAVSFDAIDLDVQAIHHYEIAMRHSATKAQALEALAKIQENAERWEAAARYWEKFSSATDIAERKAFGLAQAGLILHENLGRHHRALRLFRSAIAAGLSEPLLLLKMMAIIDPNSESPESVVILERLLQAELRPATRAKLHFRRARSFLAAGALSDARDALEDARAAQDNVDAFANSLMEVLVAYPSLLEDETVSADLLNPASVASWSKDTQLQAANLLLASGRLMLSLHIVDSIEPSGLETYSVLDVRARVKAALFETGVNTSVLDDALRDRLASLLAQPGEPEALRHLVALLDLKEVPAKAAIPLSLLSLFSGLTKDEHNRLAALHSDALDAVSSIPPFDAHKGHDAQAFDELLKALCELVGHELDTAFQLARAEQLPDWVPATGRTAQLATVVASAAGWSDFEFGTAQPDTGVVVGYGFAPPKMLVSDVDISKLSRNEQLFLLARAMYLSRGQFGFLSIVPPEESLALVAAAAALVDERNGAEFALSTGVGEEAIEYWAVFLHENAQADELMAIAPLVRSGVEIGSDGFLGWADWAYSTADRFALSVAQDLSVAIKFLKSESDSSRSVAVTGAESFRALLENEPALARLHNFAFSAPFLGLGGEMAATVLTGFETSVQDTEHAGAAPMDGSTPNDDDEYTSGQSAVSKSASENDGAHESTDGTPGTAVHRTHNTDESSLSTDGGEVSLEAPERADVDENSASLSLEIDAVDVQFRATDSKVDPAPDERVSMAADGIGDVAEASSGLDASGRADASPQGPGLSVEASAAEEGEIDPLRGQQVSLGHAGGSDDTAAPTDTGVAVSQANHITEQRLVGAAPEQAQADGSNQGTPHMPVLDSAVGAARNPTSGVELEEQGALTIGEQGNDADAFTDGLSQTTSTDDNHLRTEGRSLLAPTQTGSHNDEDDMASGEFESQEVSASMILEAQHSQKTTPPPLLYQAPQGTSETVASEASDLDSVVIDESGAARAEDNADSLRTDESKAAKSTLIASAKLPEPMADFQNDDHTEACMEPATLLSKQSTDHASSDTDKLPSTWAQRSNGDLSEQSVNETEHQAGSSSGEGGGSKAESSQEPRNSSTSEVETDYAENSDFEDDVTEFE